MSQRFVGISRRMVLFGFGTMLLAAAAGVAEAQKISLEATKRKIELADDLYILNERLLTEAGALKLGYETESARTLLETAFSEVDRHLELLLNGDPGHGLEKEHSVAVQDILTDLRERWEVYGKDLHALAGHSDIPDAELIHVREDSHDFGAKVKELVDTIYDVYGEVMFTPEELRAVTLLAHERAHLEEMKEEMVFAAVLPAEKAEHMERLQKLADVFGQTMDVLIRNHAMFGVAAPPAAAEAALASVEEHWQPKAALIAEIEANGNVTNEEIHAFFEASAELAEELDATILAYHAAMQGH